MQIQLACQYIEDKLTQCLPARLTYQQDREPHKLQALALLQISRVSQQSLDPNIFIGG